MSWEIDGPVVPPCEYCGAPGDVECEDDCVERDYRDAKFAEVDGQWPERKTP